MKRAIGFLDFEDLAKRLPPPQEMIDEASRKGCVVSLVTSVGNEFGETETKFAMMPFRPISGDIMLFEHRRQRQTCKVIGVVFLPFESHKCDLQFPCILIEVIAADSIG